MAREFAVIRCRDAEPAPMLRLDEDAQRVHLKIVYFGPGLAGKTTNLQYIFARTAPEARTPMESIATDTERWLRFSLTPRTIAPVHGYRVVFHLVTVPGTVFYDVSRHRICESADGVVFVADSQRERLEANVECLELLSPSLALHEMTVEDVALVFQYNKRDLANAALVADLDRALAGEAPRIEAIARTGEGVFASLRACAHAIVERLSRAPITDMRNRR